MNPNSHHHKSYLTTRRLGAFFAAAFIFFAASAAFGQVIRLNTQAIANPKQSVRLGDIATIAGTDAKTAESLMNLIVLPEISESRTLRAESVLMAVITQVGPGPLADRLQVSGCATCDIQIAGEKGKLATTKPPALANHAPPAAPETVAQRVPAANDPALSTPAATRPSDPPAQTLAKLIIARLQQDLATGPDDLRVSFDSMNPLLDQPAPANRRWVFRPLTRSLLGSVQFEAQLVEGVRIVQKLNVQMQVLKRETVLLATTPIARGTVVTKGNFKLDDSWMDRQMPTLLTNEKDVIGLEALRDVAAGSTLDQRDFRPVAMAARGEVVSVLFIHGNLKVQMKARAVDGGKLHDSIQVKNEATNELYDAVLIGKRLAVVGGTLDEAQEKQLREAK